MTRVRFLRPDGTLDREVEAPDALIRPLGDVSQVKLRRLVFNLSKQGPLAMRLKWFAESLAG